MAQSQSSRACWVEGSAQQQAWVHGCATCSKYQWGGCLRVWVSAACCCVLCAHYLAHQQKLQHRQPQRQQHYSRHVPCCVLPLVAVCKPGHQPSEEAEGTCERCRPGTFKPHKGNMPCQDCPWPKTTEHDGTLTIDACSELPARCALPNMSSPDGSGVIVAAQHPQSQQQWWPTRCDTRCHQVQQGRQQYLHLASLGHK